MGEVTVDLTRPEWTALEREARSEIENSAKEYAFALNHPHNEEYRDQHKRSLLAWAEVLGRIEWARVGDSGDHPAPAPALTLSADAADWMVRQRRETEIHVRELDAGDEGSYEHTAGEVFLLHVLNRIAAQLEPKAVAAR